MTRRHTPQLLTLDAILPHLRTKRVSKRNGERHVLAHCPAHDDQNASLSLTEKADGTLLWKCFAGCSQEAVRRELERLAEMERETAHPIPPSRRGETRETAEPLRTFGIAELADAKRLDAEKLRAWGLTDLPDGGIEIPYRDTNGNTVAIRYRLALDGANRFRWRRATRRACMDCGDWTTGNWGATCTCAKGRPTRSRYGTQDYLRWASLARPRGNLNGGATCGSLAESSSSPTPTKQASR